MRYSVRQNTKGGRVCAFNQYFNSKVCDDILKITSEKLILNGNTYDIIEVYLEYKTRCWKSFEKEYEIKNNVYRDEEEKEKNIYQ